MTSRFTSTLLLLLALMAPAAAHAQITHVPTGDGVAAVFGDFWNGQLVVHAITAGVDANFDGIFQPDSGDVPAQWFVIDHETNAKLDSMSFGGFFNDFPIRVGFDIEGRHLFVAQLGRLRSFDLNTLTLLDDTLSTERFNMVSFIENQFETFGQKSVLALHRRPGFTEPGKVVLYAPDADRMLDVIATGVNPQMSVAPYPAEHQIEFYTLSEGTFGQPNSVVGYFAREPEYYNRQNNGELGSGGVQLAVRDDRIYVLMQRSAIIRVLDARNGRELDFSPITAIEGPDRSMGFTQYRFHRMAFQTDGTLLVAVEQEGIRRFDPADGSFIDSIPLPDVSAMMVEDSLLYAARMEHGQIVVINLNTSQVTDTLATQAQPGGLFRDARGNLASVGSTRFVQGDYRKRKLIVFDTSATTPSEYQLFDSVAGPIDRFAYDAVQDSLYITEGNELYAISPADPQAAPRLVFRDSTAEFLTDVRLTDRYYLTSEWDTDSASSGGTVHVVRRSDSRRVLQTVVSPVTSDIAVLPPKHNNELVMLALGGLDPTLPSPKLSYIAYSPDVFNGQDTLGRGANHLLMVEDEGMVVTMNGTHELVAVEASSWDSERRPTGTSGFDGPRESLLNDDIHPGVIFTTYKGDIRFLDEDGYVSDSIDVGGRAEGITAFQGKIFAALPFDTDEFYSTSNRVAVIDMAELHVERQADALAAGVVLEQNYPNPATGTTRIRFSIDRPSDVVLSIYSLDGRRMGTPLTQNLSEGTYTVDVPTSGLAAGSYIYRLESNGTALTRTMQVVR